MGAGASKTSPNSKSAYSVQRSKRESITKPHPEQTYLWEPLSVAVEKELVVMKHSPFNSPSPMWTTSRYLCCLLSAVNNKEEAGTQLPNKDTIPKKKKNAGKSSRTIKRQHSLKTLSRNTWNHCFTMNLKTHTHEAISSSKEESKADIQNLKSEMARQQGEMNIKNSGKTKTSQKLRWNCRNPMKKICYGTHWKKPEKTNSNRLDILKIWGSSWYTEDKGDLSHFIHKRSCWRSKPAWLNV